jgi:hypothetical protein
MSRRPPSPRAASVIGYADRGAAANGLLGPLANLYVGPPKRDYPADSPDYLTDAEAKRGRHWTSYPADLGELGYGASGPSAWTVLVEDPVWKRTGRHDLDGRLLARRDLDDKLNWRLLDKRMRLKGSANKKWYIRLVGELEQAKCIAYLLFQHATRLSELETTWWGQTEETSEETTDETPIWKDQTLALNKKFEGTVQALQSYNTDELCRKFNGISVANSEISSQRLELSPLDLATIKQAQTVTFWELKGVLGLDQNMYDKAVPDFFGYQNKREALGGAVGNLGREQPLLAKTFNTTGEYVSIMRRLMMDTRAFDWVDSGMAFFTQLPLGVLRDICVFKENFLDRTRGSQTFPRFQNFISRMPKSLVPLTFITPNGVDSGGGFMYCLGSVGQRGLNKFSNEGNVSCYFTFGRARMTAPVTGPTHESDEPLFADGATAKVKIIFIGCRSWMSMESARNTKFTMSTGGLDGDGPSGWVTPTTYRHVDSSSLEEITCYMSTPDPRTAEYSVHGSDMNGERRVLWNARHYRMGGAHDVHSDACKIYLYGRGYT